MTQPIRCQVVTTFDNGEEAHIGDMSLFSPPRVGEYLWFSQERLGHRSWIVKEIAHHVGNGEFGQYPDGYQTLVIYARPTISIQE